MSSYEKKDLYQTGDSVPVGNYTCASCGESKPAICMIEKDGDKLPECPCCGPTFWIKF